MSTCFSPNELRFAQPVRGISTLLTDEVTLSEYVEQMMEDLLNQGDEATDAIIIAQEYQKKQSDKKHTLKELLEMLSCSNIREKDRMAGAVFLLNMLRILPLAS